MADKILWVENRMERSDDAHLSIMSLDHVAQARAFHGSFPQYAVTPLAKLDALAADLGLAGLAVKDESYRFGSTRSRCSAARSPWRATSPRRPASPCPR